MLNSTSAKFDAPRKCAKCEADILPNHPTANHGTFHEDCYDRWVNGLTEQLRPIARRQFGGPAKVRVAAAKAGA